MYNISVRPTRKPNLTSESRYLDAKSTVRTPNPLTRAVTPITTSAIIVTTTLLPTSRHCCHYDRRSVVLVVVIIVLFVVVAFVEVVAWQLEIAHARYLFMNLRKVSLNAYEIRQSVPFQAPTTDHSRRRANLRQFTSEVGGCGRRVVGGWVVEGGESRVARGQRMARVVGE